MLKLGNGRLLQQELAGIGWKSWASPNGGHVQPKGAPITPMASAVAQ